MEKEIYQKWGKLFNNEPRRNCGSQPSKNVTISLKSFFKDCLAQLLFGPSHVFSMIFGKYSESPLIGNSGNLETSSSYSSCYK